jgi:benzoyl-CoA reductase/2-hydroxyglutaryl-CoA dehydratase subunit BcrC/BadD/HgdB
VVGIVAVDSCDAMRRLFDTCRHFLPLKFSHILSLPHARTPEAVHYYYRELKRFAGALREFRGRELKQDELLHSIKLVNETRALLKEMDEARKTTTAFSGSHYYQALLEAMTGSKTGFNQFWRGRISKSEARAASAGARINLVLTGGVLDDTWIIDEIEEAGGRVVADDLCCGGRYFDSLVETGGDPLLRIAERHIRRAPCARMDATEARCKRLFELVGSTNARGVIHYAIKFCDPHALDWAMLNQELHREGIPTLRCEADYSTGNREQIKTRVEAFIEMLK